MNITRIFFAAILFFTCISSSSQITQPLAITTHVIKKSGVTDIASVIGLLSNEKVTTESYFDGFGRPLEEVVVGGSPAGKDILKFYKYDDLGRQSTVYLPYQRTTVTGEYLNTGSAVTEQGSFYTTNTTANKIANDAAPFAQTAFESSPLQRILKQGDVGSNFQLTSHYKEIVYRAGLASDNVRKWDETGLSISSYVDYELSAVEGIDENGVKTNVFTDKIGRTILKRQQADETVGGTFYAWFDTYFIYDNAGNVAYVIPLKAVAKFLSTGTWTQSGVPELIFSYKYDTRNRLTEKKVPGALPVYMVYDPLDRLILVQDGQHRQTNVWLYTKYDNRSRTVTEGIYTHGSNLNQADMQNYVNSQNFTTYYYETRTASTNGYSNNVFPNANITDLVYYYYDDYDFDNNGSADYSYQTQGLTGENTPTSLTNGLSTGIRKRILGTSTWLISATFYDNRYVPIQVLSNNQLNSTVADHTTNVVDFAGRVIQSKEYKNVSSTNITVLKTFEYDKMDRLLKVKQKNNSDAEIIVGNYEYNPLGQLVDKKLNSTNQGSTYLQSVDLRYTIKGQLRSINNSTLTNDGVLNDETNDVFGIELLYDQTDASLGNTANYTGLLSAVKWKAVSPANTDQRAYLFSYDKLHRLTTASYKAHNGSSWNKDLTGFNEAATYDQAGNILTMQRNSVISGSVTQIDNLSYTYTGSNDNHQLANVTESSSNSYGFKNITGSGTGYSYDQNGSLTADPKKGITIEYNELRKVKKVTKTTSSPNPYVEYRYDAMGIRISKWTYTGSGSIIKQEYIGGYVFDATGTAVLSYFGMAEGRVRNEGGTLKYEYMLSDHQGNVRVSFEDNGSGSAVLKQENSYYPFGMIATSYVPTNPNKNLYNAGSEWQDELGGSLDFFSTYFREYDPVLGRFNGVDPKAEITFSLSVYHYAGNNPINFNDPMGDYYNGDYDYVRNKVSTLSFNQALGLFMDSKGHVDEEGYWSASTGELYIGNGNGGGGGGGLAGAPIAMLRSIANAAAAMNGGKVPAALVKTYFQFAWAGYVENLQVRDHKDGFLVSFGASTQEYGVTAVSAYYSNAEIEKLLTDGEGKGSSASSIPIAGILVAADGPIPIGDVIAAGVVAAAIAWDLTQKIYLTYKLTNPLTGQVYFGRTSGYGNPASIMYNRYKGHEYRPLGFDNPQLDAWAQSIFGKGAIRGREQQLIDSYGGIGDPRLGNKIRGVWRGNPQGYAFWVASNSLFGNIAPYTGWSIYKPPF